MKILLKIVDEKEGCKMKKWVYIMIAIVIVIIAILIGCYLFQKENPDNKQDNNEINKNQTQEQNLLQENTFMNDISVSSVEQEKISPNATLILKKHYEECDHIIKEYAKIPEEYVNLTKEELEEKQEGWEVEEFSMDEITLRKEMSGVCNQHYVLRENNGVIAVYQIQDNNEEVLKEDTGIATEYLTEIDRLRLEEGIRIYGDEELNSTLEDYE